MSWNSQNSVKPSEAIDSGDNSLYVQHYECVSLFSHCDLIHYNVYVVVHCCCKNIDIAN